MEATPHEVWATYSVNDHRKRRAFIADVMLYDRLVLPIPSKEVAAGGRPEWDRWEDEGWEPYKQRTLIKVLADVAITIPWTLQRQERWKKRRDGLKEDAFWVTADLLCKEAPIYAYGVAAAVGPAYPSLKELKQDFDPTSAKAREPVPGGALPVLLGQEFLVVDDPHRSYEYQLEVALDLAGDPVFREKRASLARWQQQFLRDGMTDRASIAKALEVMRGLIEDEKAAVPKSRATKGLRYGYRFALVATGTGGAVVGGLLGLLLTLGSAALSIGEIKADAKLLEPGHGAGPGQPSPAAFFIAAEDALAAR